MKNFFEAVHPVVLIGAIFTPMVTILLNVLLGLIGLSVAGTGTIVVAIVLTYTVALVWWHLRCKMLHR